MTAKVRLQILFLLLSVVLLANLGAVVDKVLHPGILYFDKEHFIVGGVVALVTSVLGAGLFLYVRRLEKLLERLARLQGSLAASQGRLKAMFDHVPSGVAVYRAEEDGGRFFVEDFNGAAGRIAGARKAEVLGQEVVSVFPDAVASGLYEVLQRVWRTGHPEHWPLHQHADKAPERWMEYYIYKLSTGQVVAIFDDVTDRRKAEEALRASEARYRDLFENANDFVQSIEPDGRIRYVNRAWREALGYSEEEVVDRSIFDFIHPDCRDRCSQLFQDMISTQGAVGRVEVSFRAKDGRRIVAEGTTSVKFHDGKPSYTRGIFRDITERKAVEAALEQLRRQYELVLNAAGEGILGLDAQGRHAFVNPAAARMLGYEPRELLGTPSHSLWHYARPDGSEYAEQECPIYQALRGGETHHIDSDIFWRKDGSSLPVEFRANPIWADGQVNGAVVTFSDISERVKAQEERRRLQAQLLQAQKMEAIGTLTGGVAHDFNNVLTAMQGYLELAMAEIDPHEAVLQDLQFVQSGAKRAANLVRQLMLFSRKQPMDFMPLQLNRSIEDLLKLLRRFIGEDIAIEMGLSPDLWLVHGDAANLDQVVMNLAVNARDAMPKGGTLSIRTENIDVDQEACTEIAEGRPGRFVRLSMEDSGTGMGRNVLAHIFEPFFTTKKTGEGTGLGLSVVYGIVREHGGWIHVDSEPGRGTTFQIYLPAVEAVDVPDQTHLFSSEELQGHGERILLVEDEDSIRQLATRLLLEHNYAVVSVANKTEGLETFRGERGRFDLVFSDVVLPDGSGLELAEACRAVNPDVRVLLSSGYTDQKAQWVNICDKGFEFLAKPYLPADFLRTLRKIFQKSRA